MTTSPTRRFRIAAGLAAAVLLAGPLAAPPRPARADDGDAPARLTEKKVLTLDGARRAARAAAEEAERHHESGAIAIVDDGGNLLYLERLDGTFAAGAAVSIGKARTAAIFRKPTSAFEDSIKNGRTAMVALPDFTPLQGGVPIEVDGVFVGAIGVSGAASQQRDEAVATAGAAALR